MNRKVFGERIKLYVGITGIPAASPEDVMREARSEVPAPLAVSRSVVLGRAVENPEADSAIAYARRRIGRSRLGLLIFPLGAFLAIDAALENVAWLMWLGIAYMVVSIYGLSIWIRARRSISQNQALKRTDASN
jgi:hypothetical protein